VVRAATPIGGSGAVGSANTGRLIVVRAAHTRALRSACFGMWSLLNALLALKED
jgi:hypothetical protein